MNALLMLKSELSIPIPNPISIQMLGSSRCKVLIQSKVMHMNLTPLNAHVDQSSNLPRFVNNLPT
jgi:hypothetical protein